MLNQFYIGIAYTAIYVFVFGWMLHNMYTRATTVPECIWIAFSSLILSAAILFFGVCGYFLIVQYAVAQFAAGIIAITFIMILGAKFLVLRSKSKDY